MYVGAMGNSIQLLPTSPQTGGKHLANRRRHAYLPTPSNPVIDELLGENSMASELGHHVQTPTKQGKRSDKDHPQRQQIWREDWMGPIQTTPPGDTRFQQAHTKTDRLDAER